MNSVFSMYYRACRFHYQGNLAAGEWIDEQGMTWLQSAPRIKFISEKDRRKPYPLSWEEQDRPFSHLPEHLRLMAIFKVNTGCREAEVCNLRWEWERPYSGLHTTVFVVPGERVKNGDDRVIVLNRATFSVI